VLLVGFVAWVALERVETRLDRLHRETTGQVTRALDVSRRASDLASTAPYLLSQRSEFLVQRETRALYDNLAEVESSWKRDRPDDANEMVPLLSDIRRATQDLEAASARLDATRGQLRVRIGALRPLRAEALMQADAGTSPERSLVWWTFYGMSEAAVNAGLAGNLIGVGEAHRRYRRHRSEVGALTERGAAVQFLSRLETAVWTDPSVFSLRRSELEAGTEAQAALFRVRGLADAINDRAALSADRTGALLEAERRAAARTIAATRVTVAGIAVASLMFALWMSRHVASAVTAQISRASEAMSRLARGDRSAKLPDGAAETDEIGALFRAFATFRRNAISLERINRLLDRRNALFSNVFENISDGIAITDASGSVTARNPAFTALLRVDRSTPDRSTIRSELASSAFAGAAEHVEDLESGRSVDLVAPGGGAIELRASALPGGGRVWLVSDVTDRKRFTERLRKIDRMETLGQLAGDTAHDFANIISAIRTHLHLLKSEADPSVHLAGIEGATDLGASLTDRLLSFARQQALVPECVDLNALLEGVIDVVEIGLDDTVRLEVVFAPTPMWVLIDPGQLESVIVNLVLNANAAIHDAGTIRVAIEEYDGAVQLMVEDDGCGMEEAILARAIEPFFTTRTNEGGTGLGLSIAYGFAAQSKGELVIRSSPGQGTRVGLHLPMAAGLEEPVQAAQSRGSGHALLVEDHGATRAQLTTQLQSLGFDVRACATAEEAQSAIAEENWTALVTDFDLSGRLTGLDIVSLANEICSGCTTVLISGREIDLRMGCSGTHILRKPISKKALATVLLQKQQ
jgi:signal transduction histidine kinase/CheY-like chemotaxis protein/HAMP domain-containing protein